MKVVNLSNQPLIRDLMLSMNVPSSAAFNVSSFHFWIDAPILSAVPGLDISAIVNPIPAANPNPPNSFTPPISNLPILLDPNIVNPDPIAPKILLKIDFFFSLVSSSLTIIAPSDFSLVWLASSPRAVACFCSSASLAAASLVLSSLDFLLKRFVKTPPIENLDILLLPKSLYPFFFTLSAVISPPDWSSRLASWSSLVCLSSSNTAACVASFVLGLLSRGFSSEDLPFFLFLFASSVACFQSKLLLVSDCVVVSFTFVLVSLVITAPSVLLGLLSGGFSSEVLPVDLFQRPFTLTADW